MRELTIGLGDWTTGLVAKSGTKSAQINLGSECNFIDIEIPTLDSCTIYISKISPDGSNTEYRCGDGVVTHTTTGNYATGFNLGTFCRYIYINLSAAQTTAARTFYVRGVRR